MNYRIMCYLLTIFLAFAMASVNAENIHVTSVAGLYDAATQNDNQVTMEPGVYGLTDYLSEPVLEKVMLEYPEGEPRQPRWLIRFSGSDNTFDLTGVTLEIDTGIYKKLPYGYTRCIFITGENNVLRGLTVRNTGANRGSNGNTLSVFGNGNLIENVTLHVSGSHPYGYGDLLGKGGPNLMATGKQSGMMIAGQNNTLMGCRVISRAFGHCYYIQQPRGMVTENILLENCYAEGAMRSTADMLRETEGPLADHDFQTIAENRDHRYLVVPGYMKSLSEDGFRTYGGTGRVTLRNCTAINTRAGFEIAGPDDGEEKTVVDGGIALGCERAYLVGGNTIVRNSRGDVKYGPLLYLRGGSRSDVELELTGAGSDYTVHALATIAGENHRVRLFTEERIQSAPALPIMLGFAMPRHAEMASPIEPLEARNITLINELNRCAVIQSGLASECEIQTEGMTLEDSISKIIPTDRK